MVCAGCRDNLAGRGIYWRRVPVGHSLHATLSGQVGISEHYQEQPLCGDCAYKLSEWEKRRATTLVLWICVPVFLLLCLTWGITIGMQSSSRTLDIPSAPSTLGR